jgi:hypothetical protein
MNIDRINRQDREPSIRRASAMLKGVKAPEKTESEWSVLESGLLGRLGSFDHETASHRSHFPFFFPKPVALASGFAVAAAIGEKSAPAHPIASNPIRSKAYKAGFF